MNLVVSLHDVAPSKAELCRRWLDELEQLNIRVSLLVVPGYWNGQHLDSSPSFIEWLQSAQSRGHEIVMHGYQHSSDPSFPISRRRAAFGRLVARGCEEFWNLPFSEAKRRLHLGLSDLQRIGFAPKGFIAPGWLMSPDSYLAIRAVGFEYTTTHHEIIEINGSSRERVFVLSQRPQSLLSKPGIAFNSVVSSALIGAKRDFRLAIHPNDLVNRKIRQSNLTIISNALGNGYKAVTYGERLEQIVTVRRLSNSQKKRTVR